MPSPARLALGPAVALATVMVSGPVAWAGTLPCDDYSQACETPSPTPSPTDGGGGGGIVPLPTVSPTPDGDGDGGGGIDTPTPTQGATEQPGGADSGDGGAAAGDAPGGGDAVTGGGALPFTGGELVLGALTGFGAVGLGTALVVAGRRRRTGLAV